MPFLALLKFFEWLRIVIFFFHLVEITPEEVHLGNHRGCRFGYCYRYHHLAISLIRCFIPPVMLLHWINDDYSSWPLLKNVTLNWRQYCRRKTILFRNYCASHISFAISIGPFDQDSIHSLIHSVFSTYPISKSIKKVNINLLLLRSLC